MSRQRAYWDGLRKDRSPGESCPSIIQGEVARATQCRVLSCTVQIWRARQDETGHHYVVAASM
jgi:hypothetical protein